MPRTFKNLLANLLGSGSSALIGLLSIPLIIHFVGAEAYGLIGFYATLQGIFQLLDLGFSPTMSREMARYSVQPEKKQEARDLVRTLEIVYWVLALIIGLGTVIASPFLARNWLQSQTIPETVILQSLVIMGILSAVQWPITFYQGGLIGLQHQVALQTGKGIFSALRNLGGVGILAFFSPTILAFFVWQVVVGIMQVVWLMWLLWHVMPKSVDLGRPKFRAALLRQVGNFAMGMSGITLFGLLLTQMDKVILSRFLPLEIFGYYILASNLSSFLRLAADPIFNVAFPQFSALVAQNDFLSLRRKYQLIAQLIAVLIIPAAGALVFFAKPILTIWTRNAVIAESTTPILVLLTFGTALNCLMLPAYSLKLASGYTRVAFAITATLAVVLVPVILIMTLNFGAIGAASVWAFLNLSYVLIGIPITHHFALKGEAIPWFKSALIIPLSCTLIVFLASLGGLSLVAPFLSNPYIYLGSIIVVWAIAFLLCVLAMPLTRELVVNQKRRLASVLS